MLNLRTRHAGLLRNTRALAAATLVTLLAGCSWPQELHGNLPTEDAVSQIEPGKSNKADVTKVLGSPSSIATFDANTWYYIARRLERVTLSTPELLEQRVTVIVFRKDGVVADVQTHLNDTADVAMIGRTTPAPGKELSFIEQLLGNFGKFAGAGKKDKPDDQKSSGG